MTEPRKITAKVKLTGREEGWDKQLNLRFEPDYAEGRNTEWAAATPSLQLQMTVKGDVAEHFQPGAYTLTFEKTED